MSTIAAPRRSSRSPAGRWSIDVANGLTTLAAVLGSLGSALALRKAVGFGVENVIVAVVLTLTLSRVDARASRHRALAAVELPVIALAASGAGWLVVHDPWIGQPALVVALSVGILARRYGPTARQAGRLVALPFLALLITPRRRYPARVRWRSCGRRSSRSSRWRGRRSAGSRERA